LAIKSSPIVAGNIKLSGKLQLPAWVTGGALPPGLQNHSIPAQAWENGLRKFKVSFEVVRKSASQTQSGQSAIKDDIIYYYHNDHLGTPCFLTDEAGSIVWRREQTPFGVTSYERGTTTENLRFPGQYFDAETGQCDNLFRTYNPELARYIEADPMGQSGGINVYPYTGGDPMNYVDPWGLYWEYVQSTGQLNYVDNNTEQRYPVDTGYAGNGIGLNKPEMQDRVNIGPPPIGTYFIGRMKNYVTNSKPSKTLRNAMTLTPTSHTDLDGRSGGFLMHGGNFETMSSSGGCIVLKPDTRRNINASRTDSEGMFDRILEVVP
jgi:RHS repeat-associated protein